MKKMLKLLCLPLCISLLLCGCNPSKAVNKKATALFDNLAALSYDEIGSFVYPDSEITVPVPKDEKTASSFDSVYKRLEYTINSVTAEKNTATVNVTLKTPDLTNVYTELLYALAEGENIADSQEAFIAKYAELVEKAELVETTLDLPFEKLQGNWFLKPTKEFAELITGNSDDVAKNYGKGN